MEIRNFLRHQNKELNKNEEQLIDAKAVIGISANKFNKSCQINATKAVIVISAK